MTVLTTILQLFYVFLLDHLQFSWYHLNISRAILYKVQRNVSEKFVRIKRALRLIHLIRTDSNMFLFIAEWYCMVYCICATTSLSIHMFVDIQIASIAIVSSVATQSRNSVTTQRGRMGREVGEGFKREGAYVYLWPIHVTLWQKPSQNYKVIIF